MRFVLFGAALLTGCSPTGIMAGAVVIGTGYHAQRDGAQFPDKERQPPDMAPGRTVSEVDCSKPVDFSAGNIRCK